MHMRTRRSFDGDIGARVPDLRGVLAVPAPAQHVVSSLEGARAHMIILVLKTHMHCTHFSKSHLLHTSLNLIFPRSFFSPHFSQFHPHPPHPSLLFPRPLLSRLIHLFPPAASPTPPPPAAHLDVLRHNHGVLHRKSMSVNARNRVGERQRGRAAVGGARVVLGTYVGTRRVGGIERGAAPGAVHAVAVVADAWEDEEE